MGFEADPGTLAAARGGDRQAFRALVESLTKEVYNMAYRVTYNEADASDLSQEIFVTLYRNLGRYDPERPFAPWFRRVVTNTAINYRKRQRPHRALPDTLASDEPTVEGLSAEEMRVLEDALKQLPAEYRLAVGYYYYQGLEVVDIAAAMQVPVGTVKTWPFRAREALKERLGDRFGVRA